uniref:Tc1-like transposase DDE domain-containing protein n=1 Tax=Planktothricoides sp. SpSt-374 TaxID=2282167 RepID=A0A7C3VNK3_9CYAN
MFNSDLTHCPHPKSLDQGGRGTLRAAQIISEQAVIMDNAPIHRKKVIRELAEWAGHQVLFLPKYSPELNDIEPDFSALKRAKMYASPDKYIDEIIREYCAR